MQALMLLVPVVQACSFVVANFDVEAELGRPQLDAANRLSRLRGPDATAVRRVEGWTFVHNLLSMTGDFTMQPFIDGRTVALFNGEIYNYRDLAAELAGSRDAYASDGYCLLPAYARWGRSFISRLRGEFAIVIVDLVLGEVLASTDAFGTKPLWVATWEGRFLALASYESALAGLGAPASARRMAAPNRVVVFESSGSFAELETFEAHRWDLHQFKNDTSDWRAAFSRAVRRRTQHTKHAWFVGLSSGYDSGALMAALLEQKSQFLAFSIRGREATDVVMARAQLCEQPSARCEAELLELDEKTVSAESEWLRNHVEPYAYFHRDAGLERDRGVTVDHVFQSAAAIGLSHILSRVRSRGGLIYLSGSGADEYISDYAIDGVAARSSCFRGVFPDDLRTIFPWCNFYFGTQRAYLMKEELTGGAHGIETRYPFLDVDVVQEYFWLSPQVKNSEYKRPIADYLRLTGFPNAWKLKRGFSGRANVVANSTVLRINATTTRTAWSLGASLDPAKLRRKAARKAARRAAANKDIK